MTCVLVIFLLTGTHSVLQEALTDMRFRWSPREASGDIVLVAIDPPSIEKIGIWPWPRQNHADLIRRLEDAGATDIVFDVDFSSPSTPDADQSFADALRDAGGSVVLPAFKQSVRDRGNGKTIHVNRPLPQFEKHAWMAMVNVAVESDGLVRRYSFGETLDGQFLPSLGALLAGKYVTDGALLRIDFSIRPGSLPVVSFVDVLRGDPVAAGRLKDKKVIVGSTAIELGDQFSVPNGRVVPGPQLQMLAAESILQDRVLRTISPAVTVAGLIALALLMLFLWRRCSAGGRVAVLLGLAVVTELAGMLLQAKFAIMLDTSLWLMAIAAYLVAIALDEIDFRSLLGGIAERRFQRIAMSLGDGLVCADQNGLVTVWNPGRRGDLRLPARGNDRPAARPGLRARRRSGEQAVPLSICRAVIERPAVARRQGHGARRTPQERRDVPARSLLLGMAGRRWHPVRRGDARHIGPQARGRTDPVSRRVRHADRPRQP